MKTKRNWIPLLPKGFLILYLGLLVAITVFSFLKPTKISSKDRKKIEKMRFEVQARSAE